jgi:hypothetical protein
MLDGYCTVNYCSSRGPLLCGCGYLCKCEIADAQYMTVLVKLKLIWRSNEKFLISLPLALN